MRQNLRHPDPDLVGEPDRPEAATTHHTGDSGRRRGWWRFLRHYLEMIVAMLVGMTVLGPVVQGLLGLVGLAYSHAQQPELASLEMAVTMSVGMVAWMRYRGHGWASTLEMTGAMFAPAIVLIPLRWLGAIPAESLVDLTHLAMLPLMLVVMLWRREEYSASHRAHPAPAG